MDALSAVCIQEEAQLLLEMQDIRDLFGVNDLTLRAAIKDTVAGLRLPFFSLSLSMFSSCIRLKFALLLFHPILCPLLTVTGL